MRKLISSLIVALVAVPSAARAQDAPNPVSTALRSSLAGAQRNFVESAEEMPADKYGFKPTPQQMSFGQLMLHVAGSNMFMCSVIAGEKMPQAAKLTPDAPKEQIVARLKESFAYCTTELAKVDDSKLGESVPFFGGRTVTRAAAMLGLSEDWGDHYSAAATWLRLNGLLPPTARRREM